MSNSNPLRPSLYHPPPPQQPHVSYPIMPSISGAPPPLAPFIPAAHQPQQTTPASSSSSLSAVQHQALMQAMYAMTPLQLMEANSKLTEMMAQRIGNAAVVNATPAGSSSNQQQSQPIHRVKIHQPAAPSTSSPSLPPLLPVRRSALSGVPTALPPSVAYYSAIRQQQQPGTAPPPKKRGRPRKIREPEVDPEGARESGQQKKQKIEGAPTPAAASASTAASATTSTLFIDEPAAPQPKRRGRPPGPQGPRKPRGQSKGSGQKTRKRGRTRMLDSDSDEDEEEFMMDYASMLVKQELPLDAESSEEEQHEHAIEAEELVSDSEGVLRVGGQVFVPVTFTIFGQKFKRKAEKRLMSTGAVASSSSATAAAAAAASSSSSSSFQLTLPDRHSLRRCARVGGRIPTLPSVDYSVPPPPGKSAVYDMDLHKRIPKENVEMEATENVSAGHLQFAEEEESPPPSSPINKRRGRPPRSSVVTPSSAASAPRGRRGATLVTSYDEDAMTPELTAAIRASLQDAKKQDTMFVDQDMDDIAVEPSEEATPPRKQRKQKQSTSASTSTRGKLQCADLDFPAEGDELSVIPVFDETKTRQSLYLFSSRLTLNSLPHCYSIEPFINIISSIKLWMKRLNISQPRLAQEMQCSVSTIYFLITNTYKYDLTNYNIRVRHYLWRTDGWAVGRVKQWLRKPQSGDDTVMTDVSAPVAAAASSSSTPFTPPLPSELSDASISLADWHSWLALTLPIDQREQIDDLLLPQIIKLEDELDTKHQYLDEKPKKAAKVKQEELYKEEEEKGEEKDAEAELPVSRSGRKLRQARQTVAEPDSDEDFIAPNENDQEERPIRKKKEKTAREMKRQKSEEKDYKESDASSGGESESEDAASEASQDDAMSDGEDDFSDTLSLDSGGVGRSGKKSRPGARGVRRSNRSEMFQLKVQCRYPEIMPSPNSIQERFSGEHAHAIFSEERWNFTKESSELLKKNTSHVASLDVLMKQHMNIEPTEKIQQFMSNKKLYEMAQYESVRTEPAPLPTSKSASSSKSSSSSSTTLDISGFINLPLPISNMQWCPGSEKEHSPKTIIQYLAVALDHREEYISLSSATPNGLILLYSISLSPDGPSPVASLALTHSHGTCLSMAWYPYSLETFGEEQQRSQRLGVLAMIFTDGSMQVRVIPKPQSHPQAVAREVAHIQLDRLPGITLSLPLRQSSIAAASLPTPTSLCWSTVPKDVFLAIGTSDGRVGVYDFTWIESADIVLSTDNSMQQIWCTSHVLTSGTTIISGVAFHPRTSNLLALCTFAGDVDVYDLRSPALPLYHGIYHQPFRGISWPLAHHPIQQCLVLIQGNEVRMLALSQFTTVTGIEKASTSCDFLPSRQIPIHDHAIIVQMACGPRDSVNEPFFLVTANSDGTCNAFATNMERVSVCISASTGLSRTRWTKRKSDTTLAATGDEEKEKKQDSATNKILDISNSFPTEKVLNRDSMQSIRKHRFTPSQIEMYGATLTPKQMATDSSIEIHSVAVNPNFSFPRIIATAGTAGIIRLQTIRTL